MFILSFITFLSGGFTCNICKMKAYINILVRTAEKVFDLLPALVTEAFCTPMT